MKRRKQYSQFGPGSGWKLVGCSVWEWVDGTRVHLLGTCRLPDGSFVSSSEHSHSVSLWQLIRINGGNRKRALLNWARWKSAEYMAGLTGDI